MKEDWWTELEVNDTVKNCFASSDNKGKKARVYKKIWNGEVCTVYVEYSDHSTGQSSSNDSKEGCYKKIITYKQRMSDLIEKAIIAMMSEPMKSFRKSGIVNGDNVLTDDGAKILLGYLLNKNADDFKTTIVAPILAEQENEG